MLRASEVPRSLGLFGADSGALSSLAPSYLALAVKWYLGATASAPSLSHLAGFRQLPPQLSSWSTDSEKIPFGVVQASVYHWGQGSVCGKGQGFKVPLKRFCFPLKLCLPTKSLWADLPGASFRGRLWSQEYCCVPGHTAHLGPLAAFTKTDKQKLRR